MHEPDEAALSSNGAPIIRFVVRIRRASVSLNSERKNQLTHTKVWQSLMTGDGSRRDQHYVRDRDDRGDRRARD